MIDIEDFLKQLTTEYPMLDFLKQYDIVSYESYGSGNYLCLKTPVSTDVKGMPHGVRLNNFHGNIRVVFDQYATDGGKK